MVRPLIASIVLLGSLPLSAFAASEKIWSPLVRGSVPAGEADGASATSRGTIAIAPEAKERAAPPAPYLWAVARRGKDVLAGSGDGGEVWLVPEDGSAARSLLDPPELQAQAIAIGADGSAIVALNPGARVVALEGAGKSRTLFDAEEGYAWAILPEAKAKALLVAVGSPGRVYRVEPGRAAAPAVVLDSGDEAVRSLAFAKDGKLLAGTDGRGLVIRVDGDGKRFVLFDAPRREIPSISVAPDGTVWFAAVGQEGADAPPPTPGAAPAPGTPAVIADAKKGPPAQLYRMRPDGFAELVWTAPGPSIQAVLHRREGVVVATGDPGMVWLVEADGAARSLLDVTAGQATALLADGDDVLVATANPSKLFRLSTARRGVATFRGAPLDAGGFARWGRLLWRATNAEDAKVEVSTRSGNTAIPDASWSPWSAPVASGGAPVASPPARFLQWRVGLTAGSRAVAPELSSLEVVYRVQNRAPRVDSVVVEEPGVTLAPKSDAPPSYALPPETRPQPVRKELPSKRGYARGWRAARWTASDPDGDDLLYDVFVRGEGDPAWKPLAKGVPETYTTWDAASLPDGRYEIRVVATDGAVNGGANGLTGERVIGPFENDNTPPKVERVEAKDEGGKRMLRASATDAGGLAGASYAIDGGDWVNMSPEDGISDGPAETFVAELPALGPGAHVIVVRALDRAGNPGASKALAP